MRRLLGVLLGAGFVLASLSSGARAQSEIRGTQMHPVHTHPALSGAGVVTISPHTVRNFLSVIERANGGNCNVVYDTATNGAPSATNGEPLTPQSARTFETNGLPVGQVAAYCDGPTIFEVIEGDGFGP